jgi:hypothetical protein
LQYSGKIRFNMMTGNNVQFDLDPVNNVFPIVWISTETTRNIHSYVPNYYGVRCDPMNKHC